MYERSQKKGEYKIMKKLKREVISELRNRKNFWREEIKKKESKKIKNY